MRRARQWFRILVALACGGPLDGLLAADFGVRPASLGYVRDLGRDLWVHPSQREIEWSPPASIWRRVH